MNHFGYTWQFDFLKCFGLSLEQIENYQFENRILTFCKDCVMLQGIAKKIQECKMFFGKRKSKVIHNRDMQIDLSLTNEPENIDINCNDKSDLSFDSFYSFEQETEEYLFANSVLISQATTTEAPLIFANHVVLQLAYKFEQRHDVSLLGRWQSSDSVKELYKSIVDECFGSTNW